MIFCARSSYPDNTSLVVKGSLRAADLEERRGNWSEAAKIYEKVAATDVQEAKYARERLMQIERERDARVFAP